MTSQYLLIPRDPLIVRTASPFTSDPGANASSLDWPLPSTLAGAMRTLIGEERGIDWHGSVHDRKLVVSTPVHGGFLVDQTAPEAPWRPFFPAPLDAAIVKPDREEDLTIRSLRPETPADGEGTNAPLVGDNQLTLIALHNDEKPALGFNHWPLTDVIQWLLDTDPPKLPETPRGHLPRETRTHVTINRATGTAEEGHLFSTTGIAFSPASTSIWSTPKQAILCRLLLPSGLRGPSTPQFVSLGGEGRQTRLQSADSVAPDPWRAPPQILDALTGQTTFRLQLVTPALFRTGWYPGWLTQPRRDRVPDSVRDLRCALKSAVVGRRVAISGWDLRNKREKPLRYAAPAGSVYFFETSTPLTRDQINRLWLAPISDATYDREDGFGLAVPGCWRPAKGER